MSKPSNDLSDGLSFVLGAMRLANAGFPVIHIENDAELVAWEEHLRSIEKSLPDLQRTLAMSPNRELAEREELAAKGRIDSVRASIAAYRKRKS